MTSVHDRIKELVESNKIVIFMKGTPQMPMCGFSAATVEALKTLGQPFQAVNVLADPAIREGIKLYSSWPTIPQVFIGGQFVGGCDIVRELAASGELARLVAAAK
ncbi:MAG TPA: Grx4 family monothiol glutaredoxin [Polyangia bacterium]|nr:Grx4 family monothiol glutaredoxin [Polyangia bacterium]